MKEEEKIKSIKLNDLKRAASTNHCTKLFSKLFANLPNYMIAFEDPSTPLLLQFIISLSTNIIKDPYHHISGKMDGLPNLKKYTVAAEILQK